jgi:hypothetical protein
MMAFTDVVMTDVHYSLWIPKLRFRDFEPTEMIANAEFSLLNFDNHPGATAQKDERSESTGESIASNAPVHAEIA